MVYEWKINRMKTDANTAGMVCEQLAGTIGLTAENLVNVSRDKEAPLHDEFEWNDETAAEEYRKTQARFIIRNLVILQPEEAKGKEEEPVRAFFALSEGWHETNYEPVKVIMEIIEKRSQLLDIALRELIAFRKKYNTLEELAGVFEAIDNVNEKIGVAAI